MRAATGEPQVNAIGYCLGGTLLAATLAYLAATNQPRIASATYFVSMVDFTDVGDMAVFIDEEQLAALEKRMKERGYLEAHDMATSFNMLRANDLIWSFVVSNYLLGKEPIPFDLLYWNADATRMPAAMHSFYLRNMYHENRLSRPDGILLKGVPIDLRLIETPTFLLSTREDHIAPWRSTYAATQIYGGPITFVLSASGHIAGVISPPGSKYGHWRNGELPRDPDDWLEGAVAHAGSWWPAWDEWVAQHAAATTAARTPGAAASRRSRTRRDPTCGSGRCPDPPTMAGVDLFRRRTRHHLSDRQGDIAKKQNCGGKDRWAQENGANFGFFLSMSSAGRYITERKSGLISSHARRPARQTGNNAGATARPLDVADAPDATAAARQP